jgi:Fungal specific transcription factor domain
VQCARGTSTNLSSEVRFSRHPEVRQHPMSTAGDEYAAKARQLLSLEFDRPTLSNVQSLLILGLHEFGSSRGARAWMYAGIAIRMAISIGLNVEDEARLASQDWIDCEIRRRVFWATFIIGNLISAVC